MQKLIVPFIIATLVIGGGAFYGGMLYGKASITKDAQARTFGQNAMRGTGTVPTGDAQRMRIAGGAGMPAGEVLSKDDTTLTLKLADGGSNIVFISPSTTVTTMAEGSMDDVVVGSNVLIMGTSDASGNMTAKTVQLRPDGGELPFMAR
ncbi:hypothetical protein KJ781_00590 [Patescibacteria group bacterium]|nr:hypothetical protein [Patescibacteria group bacterium]MBU1448727.1 hypothetical protein [Patescibacteria group bacterium]MBU2613009.1 hypothetical protein [Patescibacteria group bacterium]